MKSKLQKELDKENEDEQKEFERVCRKEEKQDSALIKKFALRTGYYWVTLKSYPKEALIGYFDLTGSMTQTERTFNIGREGNDYHLVDIHSVLSRIKSPRMKM
jgi:hypothetical protein